MNPDIPAPDITVEGTGLLCVALLLRLRKEIDAAAPGTVVGHPDRGRRLRGVHHRRPVREGPGAAPCTV
ncbi:hypothetical protein [Streptomyces sp. CBG33]|uniref:hypothetical protein n=1 Tax=Streptomyces sp. SID8016 TaxID=2706098 RepID=UPI001EF3AF1B|nr:hypothetical protein [Streptomyces sp. CBG33]